MIRLGIIGTGWISKAFAEAASAAGGYEICGIYSREREKAEEFAKRYSNCFGTDQLAYLVMSEKIDTVYIASPNALHFEQAMAVIAAGKHVIVEKPAFSNAEEMAQVVQTAKRQQVLYFEAARHIHEENFLLMKQIIKEIGQIKGGNLTYMKRSSRYNCFLQGAEPNIFSLKYSGGALMDLGIYLVYACVSWFGVPQKVEYHPRLLGNGIDGWGTIFFHYADFDISMQTGKVADSFLKSELYGSQGTLVFSGVTQIQEIMLYEPDGQSRLLGNPQVTMTMQAEAEAFAKIIENPLKPENQQYYQELLDLSVAVNQVISQMRKDAGIYFAADKQP